MYNIIILYINNIYFSIQVFVEDLFKKIRILPKYRFLVIIIVVTFHFGIDGKYENLRNINLRSTEIYFHSIISVI